MLNFEFSELHPLSQGQLRARQAEKGITFDAGFMHRGDEKLLEVRDFRQGLSLINRHNWLSPAAAEIAYAQACEELMGIAVSDKVIALREALARLQEVTGLLQRLAGIFDDKAWLIIRETWVELTEQIAGARLHVSAMRIGGTIVEIDETAVSRCRELSASPLAAFTTDPWHGSGVLTKENIAEFGITCVPEDTHDAAQRIDFAIARVRELISQLPELFAQACSFSGTTEITLPKVVRVPVGDSYQTQMGATGRVGVWLFSDGGKSPLRLALRSPSAIHLSAIEALSHKLSFADVKALLTTVPLSLGEVDR